MLQTKQEHVQSADLWQGGLRIPVNSNRDPLVQSYICSKNCHKDPISLSGDMSQIVEKWSHDVEESFKKFLDPDPEVDDCKNLISSSLSIDTSV